MSASLAPAARDGKPERSVLDGAISVDGNHRRGHDHLEVDGSPCGHAPRVI
ncbi:MAG TPA: hypothetical protein VIT65_07570 [Microlunatus sp.]